MWRNMTGKKNPQQSASKGFQTLTLQTVMEHFFPGKWLEAGAGSASVLPLLPCSWLRQWDELCSDGPGKAPSSPGSGLTGSPLGILTCISK